MSKKADYYVSAVHYSNGDNIHIESVKRHVVSEDNSFNENVFQMTFRNTVVSDLQKITYMTIHKTDGKWHLGDNIIKFELDGEFFIRTDGNKTKSDNLVNLPRI